MFGQSLVCQMFFAILRQGWEAQGIDHAAAGSYIAFLTCREY
jgi:hypothetical protein